MWGRKKPDEPRAAKPEPKNLQGNQAPEPPIASLQGHARVNGGPVGATRAMANVAARLGANLHMKGEITGSEDLVDGTFEGLVQLDGGS